jgi:hypothetical protein
MSELIFPIQPGLCGDSMRTVMVYWALGLVLVVMIDSLQFGEIFSGPADGSRLFPFVSVAILLP